jgi:hypothetical protein
VIPVKIPFARPPSAISSHIHKWQPLLWREWRNCNDAEYARHLFELLINEPVDRRTLVILGLLGALSGALAGGWLGLWFNGGEAAGVG